MTKVWALGMATALAAGALSVGVATPASAETITIDVTCVSGDNIDEIVNIVAAPGDTIVINGGSECTEAFTNVEYQVLFTTFADEDPGSPPYTWLIRPDAPAAVYGASDSEVLGINSQVSNCSGSYATNCGTWFYLTIAEPGSAGASKDLTIWQKQVGRASAEASCQAGYSPSWARWPNGGTGGWVCTKDTYAFHPDEPVS